MKDYDLILESAVTGDLFEEDEKPAEEKKKETRQKITKGLVVAGGALVGGVLTYAAISESKAEQEIQKKYGNNPEFNRLRNDMRSKERDLRDAQNDLRRAEDAIKNLGYEVGSFQHAAVYQTKIKKLKKIKDEKQEVYEAARSKYQAWIRAHQ